MSFHSDLATDFTNYKYRLVNRSGLAADLAGAGLHTGEFAVTTDTRHAYACVGAGDVVMLNPLWFDSQIITCVDAAQNVAQVIQIVVPNDMFTVVPGAVMAQCGSTAGIVCGYDYGSSSVGLLSIWVLKCDGALAAGDYRFSIFAA